MSDWFSERHPHGVDAAHAAEAIARALREVAQMEERQAREQATYAVDSRPFTDDGLLTAEHLASCFSMAMGDHRARTALRARNGEG